MTDTLFVLYDDNNCDTPGTTFDTLAEALGGASFDRLREFTICQVDRSGNERQVYCAVADGDDQQHEDTDSLEDHGQHLGSYAS